MIKIDNIIKDKKKEVELEEKQEPIEELLKKIKGQPPTRDFFGALKKPGINIIAEIKIKSPSMPLKENLNPVDLAKEYEESKISAISVLTDEKYFGGTKEIMQKVKEITTKPILRKDFIISEYQIYQARAYGADAILLISHLLNEKKIKKFIEISRELGMECLVEFNNEQDLEKIPKDAVKIYGRNYRILNNDHNLEKNIHDDIRKSSSFIDLVPEDTIKVAESSIKSKEDINYLKKKGFNAFLIGSLFSESKDIKKTINEILS